MVKKTDFLKKFLKPLSKYKAILLILFMIFLIHLPFLNQAFHIDDTYFFSVAKQILRDPLHPFSFKINWDGKERMAFDFSGSPPLSEYYLAIIMKFFGESESVLHFSMIIYTIIVSLCLYILGKRFTRYPLFCAILTLSTPAFLVMAHTIMLDIPSFALFLVSITSFIYGFDKDDNFLLVCSGIFCGLAALIKYNTLLLIPLSILYSFTQKGKWDKRILYLSIGFIIFLIYSYYLFITYGGLHFSRAASFVFLPKNFLKILLYFIALSSYIGGSTIIPISLIFVSFFLTKNRLGYYIVFIISLLIGVFAKYRLGFNIAGSYLLSFFIFAFISFFYTIFRENSNIFSLKNKWVNDNIFLFFWIIGIICFHTLVAFVAVRFILYLIPPIAILFYRLLEKNLESRFINIVSIITIVLTCSLGLLVSWSDSLYANVYRDFSYRFAVPFKTKENNLWYAGHWGFQFYMDKQNFFHLENFSTLPKKGDILVIATRPEPEILHLDLMKRLRLIEIVRYTTFLPIRTMNDESHAGFYSSSSRKKFTFLPFSFSSSILEEFIIYEVIQ